MRYRQIHTKIWKDGWFLDLCHEHKLLFIYLFSNERANLLGLYDLSPRVMAFETGLSTEQVHAGLDAFRDKGKAIYQDGWIWIPNLLRYNASNLSSPKIQQHLKTVLAEIPDIPLRQLWIDQYNRIFGEEYPIDTVCIPSSTEHEHDIEHEHETEHETEQQTEDRHFAAVALAQAGMDHAESVLDEALGSGLTYQDIPLIIAKAKRENLGPGWIRTQCRSGTRAPPMPDPDDRSGYVSGEYGEFVKR